jgi:dolichyl-phosphate-mannose-protein mannosyltransferase
MNGKNVKHLSPRFILTAVTVAVLAPFLDKAFHIDDPLFLWMAQQISKHPLDPYGFDVNWTSSPEPMWVAMQNPPFCSYLIATFAAILGWSEVALHLAFLLPAIAAILGTYSIARRFSPDATTAALLTIFTPAFLVSGTTLMCDVLLLACWVWSIELWLAGLQREKIPLLVLSAILATAAVLTKYFGIALVPLLATYTIVRDRRLSPRIGLLLLPVAATVAYEVWTKAQYSHGLFAEAARFTRASALAHPHSVVTQLCTGLSFTGGCLFPTLFFFPHKSRKLLIAGLGALVAMLACYYFFFSPSLKLVSENNRTAVLIEAAIFATIGLAVIVLALGDLIESRKADSILLTLWLIGTFYFATFCNWSITARTILPMVPAAAILLVRRLTPAEVPFSNRMSGQWPVFTAAIVSLAVATADCRQANSARDAAYSFQRRFRAETDTVWFQGHWGFQYYMQLWGAKPWNAAASQIVSGDIMIIPLNSTAVIAIPPEKVFEREELRFGTFPFITTFGYGTGASFYSSVRGPVPWAIDDVPPETYYVARFR